MDFLILLWNLFHLAVIFSIFLLLLFYMDIFHSLLLPAFFTAFDQFLILPCIIAVLASNRDNIIGKKSLR